MNSLSVDYLSNLPLPSPHLFAVYLRNQVVCFVEFPIFWNIILRLFNMFPEYCVCNELVVRSINLIRFRTELITRISHRRFYVFPIASLCVAQNVYLSLFLWEDWSHGFRCCSSGPFNMKFPVSVSPDGFSSH